MTTVELAELLVRAVYLADGGDLPAMDAHYRINRHRYVRMAAALLTTLADHPVHEQAGPRLRALADVVSAS